MNKILLQMGLAVKLSPRQAEELSHALDERDALAAQVELLKKECDTWENRAYKEGMNAVNNQERLDNTLQYVDKLMKSELCKFIDTEFLGNFTSDFDGAMLLKAKLMKRVDLVIRFADAVDGGAA